MTELVLHTRNTIFLNILNFFISKLPNHFKQFFFMASLLGYISRKAIDDKKIRSINEILCLAKNTKSYSFPIGVSDMVWSSLESNQTIHDHFEVPNKEDCINTIDEVYKNTPNCLKYDTEEVMKTDLRNLFDVYKKQSSKKLINLL